MNQSYFSGRRSIVLGLVACPVVFVGLVTISTEITLFLGRLALLVQDDYTRQSWTEKTFIAGSSGWYTIEGITMLSAAVAAYAGSWLAPRRSKVFGLCTIALALVVQLFAQYPTPGSSTVLAIWALAPAIGALVGIGLQWRTSRGEA